MKDCFKKDLFRLRLAKAWFAATHPGCWRALSLGVAPSIEHQEVIASLKFDRLIDVGANRGQFSLMTRLEHPAVPIYAFEPLSTEAAIFRRVFARDSNMTLHEIALSTTSGSAEIHLSRRADSSSMLPIGEQSKLFPGSDEVGTLIVQMAALDEVVDAWETARNAMLKIDVQGFELSVLKGAKQALKSCAYVYAECSEVPLYTGQALYPEVASFLASVGFKPIRRANEQYVEGRLIQADHLFARS